MLYTRVFRDFHGMYIGVNHNLTYKALYYLLHFRYLSFLLSNFKISILLSFFLPYLFSITISDSPLWLIRVEYKQLDKLRNILLDVPFVALTATATEK
jgi:hypothetical protein